MKRKMMLRTITLLSLTFLMGISVYAQEKKDVKKVKIVKIDEDGNKIVEERVIEGDDATIILDNVNRESGLQSITERSKREKRFIVTKMSCTRIIRNRNFPETMIQG